MSLPDFAIIGATKSGTTSVFRALQQHPQIFTSSIKEPHFFAYMDQDVNFCGPGDDVIINRRTITRQADYEQLFTAAQPGQRKGEASALYIYAMNTAHNIYQIKPDMKLIAVLRNPIERAYSAYQHMRRDGREPYDNFLQAFENETERKSKNWSPIFYYRDLGFYYQQLERYYQHFPAEQILTLLYEDIKTDWPTQFRRICEFLDVQVLDRAIALERHNKSGRPKNQRWHNFLRQNHLVKELFKPFVPVAMRKRIVTQLVNQNLAEVPCLSFEEQDFLLRTYHEDIEKLQAMIGRDLGAWLKSSAN